MDTYEDFGFSPINDSGALISRAKAYKIIAPGFVGTLADIRRAVELHELAPHIAEFEANEDAARHPDEDGEKALMRYLEGGWDRGRYADLPEYAK